MKTHDARWMAVQAAAAAWTLTLQVESAREDIDGAIAAEDYPTAVECASLAMEFLGHCSLLLDGHHRVDGVEELLTALTVEDPQWVHTLCDLPTAANADLAAAETARAVVDRIYRKVLETLPFTVPKARTPQGFYPSLRIASQVEKLRTSLGLEPFEWDFG
jgi:hypothetical protein